MRRLTQTAQNDNDDLINEVQAAIEKAIAARVTSATFEERESAALDVSNEAVRRLLESSLQRMADAVDDTVHYDVHAYRRHEPGEVKYHSLCGALHVRRWTYRATGIRNGPTIVPLELRAGLIENGTPALAYALARGYAKAPVRSVEQDLHAARRSPPSRATLERMAKKIGTDAKKSLMEIERRVRATEALPEGATGITIGMDRTTIPMEEDVEETSKRGKDRKPRVAVHYRMAFVGTVAITNVDGDVLRSWRYAVPAHEGGRQVARRMINDVRHALGRNPKLHIGVVQDGATEVWNLVREAFADAGIERSRWHEAIDMFHLFERIAAALEVVEPDAEKRRDQLRKWKRRFMYDDSTITRVGRFFELNMPLRWWFRYPVRRWTRRQYEKVDDLLGGYILQLSYFHYSEMVRLGLHVGSGITEGACKSMITARAKRSGQRWRPQGISAVLTLRTLVESDRFDAFWKRFAARYAPLARAA